MFGQFIWMWSKLETFPRRAWEGKEVYSTIGCLGMQLSSLCPELSIFAILILETCHKFNILAYLF